MFPIRSVAYLSKLCSSFGHFSKCRVLTKQIQNVRNKKSSPLEAHMMFVLQNIRRLLSCTEEIAMNIYDKFPSIRSTDAMGQVKCNIELLMQGGISLDSIAENPYLLTMKTDILHQKLNRINAMQPRHIEDFVPLLELSEPVLREISFAAAEERDEIPEKSRIYYLSKELLIKPQIVSKHCSKFEYIFSAPFSCIDKKLKILLDYNVAPLDILQSLYIFACSDEVFIMRLEQLLLNGVYDIKLWFFKCTDDHFNTVLRAELLRNKVNTKKVPAELVQKFEQRKLEKELIQDKLNSMLSCDDTISAKIYYNYINQSEQLDRAKENIKFLRESNINLESILSNPVTLTMSLDEIKTNLKILKEMEPNAIEDFLPLIEVRQSKLEKFREDVKMSDKTAIPGGHPIYYFSKKLKLSPSIVSKYFAKHTSVYFGDFHSLRERLDVLVKYNVEPLSVLSSAHTFKLCADNIESSLKAIKSHGIEKIASWMIVAGPDRLNEIVARQVEEKNSLDGCSNTIEYLSKRLNWDQAAVEKAIRYYPPLSKCRVSRVKAHLDYLLGETHFTIDDINSHISVFQANLDELKARMTELHAIEHIPKKLYAICLDKNRYLKMVERICKKAQNKNAINKFKLIEVRIKEK